MPQLVWQYGQKNKEFQYAKDKLKTALLGEFCCEIRRPEDKIDAQDLEDIKAGKKIIFQTKDGQNYTIHGRNESGSYLCKTIKKNDHTKSIEPLLQEKEFQSRKRVTIKDSVQLDAALFLAQSSGISTLLGQKLRRSDHDALQHSFIVVEINNKPTLLAMASKEMSNEDRYIGKGKYGSAKLAEDEEGNLYVLKIESIVNYRDSYEGNRLDDLGIGGKTVVRHSSTKKKEVCNRKDENLKNKSFRKKVKFYTPMEYLGIPLNKYLEKHKDSLKYEEKLDLAIQLLQLVNKLHQGELSKQKNSYVHCDIKPENITVTIDKNNKLKLHLIDFGFSRKDENSNKAGDSGTPLYMFRKSEREFFSQQQQDILACFRVMRFPDEFYSYSSKKKQDIKKSREAIEDRLNSSCPQLFSNDDLENHNDLKLFIEEYNKPSTKNNKKYTMVNALKQLRAIKLKNRISSGIDKIDAPMALLIQSILTDQNSDFYIDESFKTCLVESLINILFTAKSNNEVYSEAIALLTEAYPSLSKSNKNLVIKAVNNGIRNPNNIDFRQNAIKLYNQLCENSFQNNCPILMELTNKIAQEVEVSGEVKKHFIQNLFSALCNSQTDNDLCVKIIAILNKNYSIFSISNQKLVWDLIQHELKKEAHTAGNRSCSKLLEVLYANESHNGDKPWIDLINNVLNEKNLSFNKEFKNIVIHLSMTTPNKIPDGNFNNFCNSLADQDEAKAYQLLYNLKILNSSNFNKKMQSIFIDNITTLKNIAYRKNQKSQNPTLNTHIIKTLVEQYYFYNDENRKIRGVLQEAIVEIAGQDQEALESIIKNIMITKQFQTLKRTPKQIKKDPKAVFRRCYRLFSKIIKQEQKKATDDEWYFGKYVMKFVCFLFGLDAHETAQQKESRQKILNMSKKYNTRPISLSKQQYIATSSYNSNLSLENTIHAPLLDNRIPRISSHGFITNSANKIKVEETLEKISNNESRGCLESLHNR